jgi:predicted nucleic acid-binding protein
VAQIVTPGESGTLKLFLDANILYSAAHREDSKMARLWQRHRTVLLTCPYAIAEATRNLKEQEQQIRLASLLGSVVEAPDVSSATLPADLILPEKDRPILAAAIASGADCLITGDVAHFGRYYGNSNAGIRVEPPAMVL